MHNRVNRPFKTKSEIPKSFNIRFFFLSYVVFAVRLPRDRSHCAPQRIWRLSIGTRHQYININTWQNRYINVGQRCWVSCHPCITRRWNSSASTWRITLLHCGKRMCRIRDRTMFESELLTRASAEPIFIYWKYVVALLVSFLSVNSAFRQETFVRRFSIVDRIFEITWKFFWAVQCKIMCMRKFPFSFSN